jgi:predicted dehydrogenase
MELVGTAGSVAWRQEDPEHLWWGRYPERMEREARPGSVAAGAPTTMPYPAGHPVGWPTALRLGIEAFVAAVASRTTPKLVASWQAAYRMMVLADMVQKSVETGQWVAAEAR